jgi:ABC-2 type transport system ATP-binding protein
MNDDIIVVEDLQKQYTREAPKALAGISFSVRRGEVFGFLGPNGAGKSSTIRILTTRAHATGGRATINGIDVERDPLGVKPHIAVVPQRNNLDRSLTAIENLTFHAAYFGICRCQRRERAFQILQEFGLGERARDKVEQFSEGMAQRLLIARALMHAPQVLFLDEPTTGLDPQSRLSIWEMIRTLNVNGLTVFLTTHDMDEAAKLCERVAILDHGKILALDCASRISQLLPAGTRIELRVGANGHSTLNDNMRTRILADVKNLSGVTSAEWIASSSRMAGLSKPAPWMLAMLANVKNNGKAIGLSRTVQNETSIDRWLLRLYAMQASEATIRTGQIILSSGLELLDLHVSPPTLEDVFIHLTGRGLRE